jgi:hypothetical protein
MPSAIARGTASPCSFAAPQRLFSGPYVQRTGGSARAYDVARDGRFLMLLPEGAGVAAVPTSTVMVQNFAEEIRQRARPSGR